MAEVVTAPAPGSQDQTAPGRLGYMLPPHPSTHYATADTATLRRSSIAWRTACVTVTVRTLFSLSVSKLRSPCNSHSNAWIFSP
jgi:hypothetical protein